MVDFVAVIERAVNGLNDNTPEMRQKVYEKARGAIRRQLESIDPPVSEAVRHRQLAKLEEAIQQIEDANTESIPEIDEDSFAHILSDGQIDENDFGEEEPVSTPPSGSGRLTGKLQPVLGPETEEDQGYDTDDIDDLVDRDPDHLRDSEVSDYLMPSKKRTRATLMGAVAALLLIVVLGAGMWMFGDRVTALVFGPEPDTRTTDVETPATPASQDDDVAGGNEPISDQETAESDDDTGPADEGPSKFTQRLMEDGSEVDDGPGANLAASTDSEGRSVAALDQNQEGGTAPATTAPQAQEPAATSPSNASTAPVVGQKMFLYEERLGQEEPTAEQGTVIWNIVRESPGDDQPPEPAIEAQINVPETGISAIMTIKRNADKSLPASHLIEIVFALSDQFDGSGIGAIQNFAMKQTEQDTGDSLIAVPAKITDSFFMIALNDYVEAVDLNLKLLRERNWIDLPVSYGNGRRALLTMEKGSSGAEIFDQVIRAWEARTTSSTQ
ncbi:MAG: hypothetical protein AAGC96_01075 [Pseudomonadota bacterium]